METYKLWNKKTVVKLKFSSMKMQYFNCAMHTDLFYLITRFSNVKLLVNYFLYESINILMSSSYFTLLPIPLFIPSIYPTVYSIYISHCIFHLYIPLFNPNIYPNVYSKYISHCIFQINIPGPLYIPSIYSTVYSKYISHCIFHLYIKLYIPYIYPIVYSIYISHCIFHLPPICR